MPSVRFLARRIAALQNKTRWPCPKRELSSYPPRPNEQNRNSDRSRRPATYRPKQLTQTERQDKAASLVEQLFPEETKRYEAQQADRQHDRQHVSTSDSDSRALPSQRSVPLIVRTPAPAQGGGARVKDDRTAALETAPVKIRWGAEGQADAAPVSETEEERRRVIHVRNASANLTEADFRRLVPRGKHIEGWRSDAGDIIKAMPVRDPGTLLHQGEYYLLFGSIRAADEYIAHARQIQAVAAKHIPQSEFSAIAPPPGYEEDGVDIDSVVHAYTVALPTRPVNMTILAPPYSGFVKMLAKYNGVPPYQTRSGRTPFEVRFTMEGPQLTVNALRHVILEDGIERGQPWSGTESTALTIWEWDTKNATPLTEAQARDNAAYQARRAAMKKDSPNPNLQRRTQNPIFIFSFPTSEAAQSFVCYWHKRTIDKKVLGNYEMVFATDAPVANVQLI